MFVIRMAALATIIICIGNIRASVVYDEAIPAFRFDFVKYAVRNGATGGWTNGQYVVTVPDKPNFWMDDSSFPGQRPVRGMKKLMLVTDADELGPGETCIHMREFPNGPSHRFKGPIASKVVFDTNLDPAKRYYLTCISVHRAKWDRRPWCIRFLSLMGKFETDEAHALRVDTDTGNPMRLVREGSEAEAFLVVRNASQSAISAKGALEMKGFFGDRFAVPVDVTLAANATERITLPKARKKGVWRIGGELVAGDGSRCKVDVRFAMIDRHDATPRQPKGTFRLGVNYHMGRFSPGDRRLTLQALEQCGAKLVRANIGATMSAVLPNGPDDWRFETADENLSLLEHSGLSVDTSVFFLPKWAALPEHRTNTNWHVWAEGRPVPGVFERFCEAVARRYGTRIDYYEIGNEWDLGFTGTIDDALAIQREAYDGLKRGNPAVCVIPNGWAAPGDNPQVVRSRHAGFHEEFLRRGAAWFDVHPIHIHGGFADYAKQIEGLFFPLRKRTGVANKPWYSNETSMTSLWNERSTALLVWKKIMWAWSRGSTDYIWYNLRATGWDPKDHEQGYGMITADYMPRDSFVAFAAFATTFGGKRFRREAFHLASRYVMEFESHDGLTLGAWDETATAHVAVKVRSDAKRAWRVDVMGNRTETPINNGYAELLFGSEPAALVLVGATFAECDKDALADIPPPNANPTFIPPDAHGRAPDFILDRPEQVHDFFQANPAEIARLWKGPQDHSAKVWLSRAEEYLRVRVDVTDDVHFQTRPGKDQYMEDDVQLALGSYLQQGHWEFGFARCADGRSSVVCWLAPTGFNPDCAATAVTLFTSREGKVTHYDASIPLKVIGFGTRIPEQGFRFNVLVNDNDGDGRDAFIEILPGSFSTKDAATYPFVRFK